MFGKTIYFVEVPGSSKSKSNVNDGPDIHFVEQAAALLAGEGLGWDAGWDFFAAGILPGSGDGSFDGNCGISGKVVSTAFVKGEVIRGVCVDPAFRGEGIALETVSRVVSWMACAGRCHHFVFTTPAAAPAISSLGLHELARVEGAVLLEGGAPDFGDYVSGVLERLSTGGPRYGDPRSGDPRYGDPAGLSQGPADQIPGNREFRVSAVVVNCNPMTLGHLHLITQASLRSERVLVFVVTSDESSFPTKIRMDIVSRECAAFDNVWVLPTGPYMVSSATFPSYFVREGSKASTEAALDAVLFARKIAPALGIKARFAGEEPYCPTTSAYNSAMARILPESGVAFVEIPRLCTGESEGSSSSGMLPVSASKVRDVIRNGGGPDDLNWLVPKGTVDFLRTDEGARIMNLIRSSSGRH